MTWFRIRLILFYLWLTIGKIDLLSGQVPSFRQFSLRQGLPQSEVSTLFQDSRGLVWVGTRGGGLVQFDGSGNRVYNNRDGLQSDFIADVQELPDRRLAIGLTYGGIQYFDHHRFSGKDVRFKEYSETRKVALVDSQVYGIGNRIVFRMQRNSQEPKTIFRFPQPLAEIFSVAVLEPRLILLAEDSGVWILDTRVPVRSRILSVSQNLGGKKVVGINTINNTSAALVSADGCTAVLEFEGLNPVVSNWNPLRNGKLRAGEEISCMVFGLGQRVKWFATNKRRIVSSTGEEIDLSQSGTGYFHSISGLLVDRNGTLWIGTQGSGLVIKPAHTAYSFENFPSLTNTNLRTVYINQQGNLMAGGRESGLILKEPDPITGKDRVSVFFPELSLFSIGETQKEYALGTDKGLVLVSKKDMKLLRVLKEPGKVILLKALEEGGILVGSYGNGAWRLDPKGSLHRLGTSGKPPEYIYGFEKEPDGNFLIPSNSGLWRLNPISGEIRNVPVPDTVGSVFFSSTQDSYGNFWFSTTYGLAGRTSKGWRTIREKNGLSSNLVYTLNADAFGHLWIGTNHGLDRITVRPDGNLREIRNFGPEEGYDGYEANMRGSRLHDHLLYVCTIQGLFAMPVKSKVLDPLPPRPEITGIRASFRGSNWTDSLPGLDSLWFVTDIKDFVIRGNPDGLAFSFGAVNPIYPNRLLYSYRLEGEGAVWSPLSHTKEAFALNPDPGKYTFSVRSSYDGITFSRPAVFSFQIEAPWYLRTWALLTGLAILMAIVAFSGRSLLSSFSEEKHFRRELGVPEKTSQIILLIFALFYPVTQLVSARFESSVNVNLPVLGLISVCIGLFFLSTFLIPAAKRNIRVLLIASFLIFIADSVYGLIQSNMAPYHIVALLYISSLAYLVFNKYWQIILFGFFLNALALWCNFHFEAPLYSPISFQMGATGLSIILIIIHLAKQSGEEKLMFANKVVNSGPVLVLGFRTDGTLVFSSENMLPLLGYSNTEVGGRVWWSELMVRNEDVMAMLGVIQEKGETELKVHLKAQNGEIRVFKFAGRPINQEIMVLIGQDITDRESLEARFENLVENAPDAIYQTDFYGQIVYANPQTSFILGIPNNELIGRNYREFLRADVKDTVEAFYREQTQKRVASTYHEFPIQTRNGQTRWLGFQVSLLTSDGGKVIDGYLSIGRDITERLEAEQLIQHQHKNITDSLYYASRIKSALFPGETQLKSVFTHVSVYNKPKDIIGGDFYWLTQSGKKHLFVVGDCTGHGVPGAFMTTIAVGLLREIAKEGSDWNLEEILGLFNRSLVRLLGMNSEMASPDFVELALLVVDFDRQTIQFLNSGISLNRIRNQQVETFAEGSRGSSYRYDYKGMSQEIAIQPGDVFFVFTDGMFDQLGGPLGKRLTRKGLLEIIRKSDLVYLNAGTEEIRKGLEAWQGSVPQIDDRLMISFRF